MDNEMVLNSLDMKLISECFQDEHVENKEVSDLNGQIENLVNNKTKKKKRRSIEIVPENSTDNNDLNLKEKISKIGKKKKKTNDENEKKGRKKDRNNVKEEDKVNKEDNHLELIEDALNNNPPSERSKKIEVPTEKTNEKEKNKVKVKKEDDESKPKVSKIKKKDKEKDKDLQSNDVRTTVLNYLVQQNRPYSFINIFDNLHATIKKALLQKTLDQLAEEGEIICKEYNSKIYLASQKHFAQIDQRDIDQAEKEIDETREQITSIKEKLNHIKNELRVVQMLPSNEELQIQVKNESEVVSQLKAKLSKLEDKNYEKIPEQKMEETEQLYEKAKVNAKLFRKIHTNMVGTLSDMMEMKVNEFMELLRIYDENDLSNNLKFKL